ncbi:MAG: NCS2 family permease [Firmicutes bacterium]|nr:NCS2 family permease [Bacillota bacterium]
MVGGDLVSNSNFLEKMFKLKAHGTNVRTEIIAGITTFMTMAYIIIVNPNILEGAGMDFGAVLTATCLAAGLTTILMALYANYPFGLAPGMGLNAFFAVVVVSMGYSWQVALTAIFVEGIIFILLSFLKVREAIMDSIPMNLKYAVSVGIGLFIAFIGFANAGIVEAGGAILQLGDMTSPTAILVVIGLIITGVLLHKKVKGALFIGILLSTVIGIFMRVAELPTSIVQLPLSMKPTFLAAFTIDWDTLLSLDFLVIVFTFLFVDIFDTVGTVIGVASKAKMLDEKGQLPRANRVLLTDAIGTVMGSLFGTSTVTTYVESASGVAEGGRTGLTALTTGVLFLLALFFSPIFLIIPSAATAPALILVGLFMMEPIFKIDLKDYTEAIPAFLTILMMPIAYSIAEGIVFGMLSYTLLKLFTGRVKEIPIIMYVLSAIFVLRFFI